MDLMSVRIAAVNVVAAIVLACGAPLKQAPGPALSEPAHITRLDPVHVKATRDNERLAIDAYDAAGLFERAAGLVKAGRHQEAIEMYKRLAVEFPDSRFSAPSLYNAGLCHEHVGLFQEAAGDYMRLVEKYPGSRDVTDAMFRLAGTYEKIEAWNAAAQTFGRLLTEREDLKAIERVEALARRGASLIQADRPDEAGSALEEAVRLSRTGGELSPSGSAFYHGMARFKLGEIVHAEMRQVELPADEALLEPALEKKCRLLLDAQKLYTKSIKVGHPHWAAAAAFRIGDQYRSLWDDIIAAPPPKDLTAEEREIYIEIVKDRIRNLLSKAVKQWERTIKMAHRLNLSNEWVDRTQKELEEIREILLPDDDDDDVGDNEPSDKIETSDQGS